MRKGLLYMTVSLTMFLTASCLKDMPESIPENLEWNPELAIPLGEENYGLNLESGFDTLLFELDSLTGLPEWIEMQVIILEGRMDFDLSTLSENLDHVNRILMRVNIYNGFPNDLLAQAYFVNDNAQIVDSMFNSGSMPVPPGTVIGDGETIDPAYRRKDALFDTQRL